MIIKCSSWSDIKGIIDDKYLNLQYISCSGYYDLYVNDGNIIYQYRMVKDSGSDQTDFENNYKSNANSKNFVDISGFKTFPISAEALYIKGYRFEVTGGQTNQFSRKFTQAVHIYGGFYSIEGDPYSGDYVEFEITDEDNILGYGAGYVVVKYVETEYINPDYKRRLIKSDDAKEIPAGLYLTVKYYSSGSSPDNDVNLYVYYNLRRA